MASLKLPYMATAALSGGLFGAGLYVSQMVDPLKVLRFLDFGAIPSGGWDPSLAFVIGPAIVVMFIAIRLGRRRDAPLFDSSFHEPEYRRVDGRLIGGAAMFGIGWGMAGICPGPAISLIAFMPDNLWIFLAAMFAGSLAGSVIVPSGHARRLADAQ
ncbi:MAG: YeeE/YedE family protein [Alphaproteobacteria bacterium]|nr:YeeE/YedE family protein [Alphaproteobacteria bacterium]MBU1561448.1 YeeE/YedE family protein [Alphaproteobacteria bacterium]MBU2302568.1 YeeE/YedE family protein [Alphaproteobacteria bacterium]MBU2367556.1 YeeE/YedE family protein [Alphaproteobacteria bacterium]